MYLPNSTKAAEFLCHEEVMQTLAYAQENKNNLPMIQEILAKARLQKGLTHSYFATGFELIIFKLYVFFLFFKILCFTLSSTGDIYPNKKAHKDF